MASGCDGDRQFPRSPELFDQRSERFSKVFKGRLFGVALAVSSEPGPELGVGTPRAVFVLLNDDRYRHGARLSHGRRITRPPVLNGLADVSALYAGESPAHLYDRAPPARQPGKALDPYRERRRYPHAALQS